MENLIFLFLVCNTFAVTEEKRIPIAILELKANVVSQEYTQTIQDILLRELLHTGKFKIIERKELNKILHEHSLQLTGLTGNQYAMEVGKILNVSKVVLGSINTFSLTMIRIEIRVVDVNTGEVKLAESEEFKYGRKDTQFFIKRLSYKIAGINLKRKTDSKRISSYICAGASAVSGALAIFCNSKADNSYDKYVTAVFKDDAIKYRKETEDADKMTSIFLTTTIITGLSSVALYCISKEKIYSYEGLGSLMKNWDFCLGPDLSTGGMMFTVSFNIY